MTDPNVQTDASGDEVILEPGDPGYVEPGQTTEGEAAPPGEDLQHIRQPDETEAEFAARTRNVVVDSQSPTDIVPNMPQISMGPRVPVEGAEGVSYATAPVESAPSVVEEQPAEETAP